MTASSLRWICASCFIGAIAATWFAYAAGLNGVFIFDDFGNLPALGAYGPVDNTKTLLYYLTSGAADPVGRPLAMASFLIDANDWPADPEPFKRTNLLIHLLNGVLLCALLLRIGRLTTKDSTHAEWAAVLGTALWLLHPLWASTVLYVVQREAMLSATFILLGLLTYLHGRNRIVHSPLIGSVWVVGGVGLCTLLALLSKANGILLPLLVVVVELIFIRSQPGTAQPKRALSRCFAIAIYPAAGAVIVYLLYVGWQGFIVGVPSFRPWTMSQRVLTEQRVLLDYLHLLVLPRPYSSGLFNDAYSASQDWLHPWSTLPSLLLVVAMLAGAIGWRKRQPALALGIAFYFAGHVLESTTVPLELYFEHRNYLPSVFLLWALALWLTDTTHLRHVKPVFAVIIVGILAVETYAAADIWGDMLEQARIWAVKSPDSPRAQSYAATTERAVGLTAAAESRLRDALRKHPNEVQLAINLLGTACKRGGITEGDVQTAERALRIGTIRGPIAFDWVERGIELVQDNKCQGLSLEILQRLVAAARKNPGVRDLPRFAQTADNLEGRIALALGDNMVATNKFRSALEAAPSAEVALSQAALLGSCHLPLAALQQLDDYEMIAEGDKGPAFNMQALHAWLLQHNGYWQHEIAHMRAILREDLQRASLKPQASDP